MADTRQVFFTPVNGMGKRFFPHDSHCDDAGFRWCAAQPQSDEFL